jgi:hypothetical protein
MKRKERAQERGKVRQLYPSHRKRQNSRMSPIDDGQIRARPTTMLSGQQHHVDGCSA